jgi:hypothetical protein
MCVPVIQMPRRQRERVVYAVRDLLAHIKCGAPSDSLKNPVRNSPRNRGMLGRIASSKAFLNHGANGARK